MATKYTPDEKSAQTIPITVDPEVRGGVPCVGENRWPISRILERIAFGTSTEDITKEFAGLTVADIRLALEAAAWVMRDPSIDWAKQDLQEMVEFQREMRGWKSLSDRALRSIDNTSED